MTILDVLEEDHREISEILIKISRTRNAKSREKLFVEMKQNMELHAVLEQMIFYNVLQDHPANKDQIQHAQDEHQRITDELAELDSIAKDDESWMPKFRIVKKDIESHVHEEETDLFQRARETLDQKRLEQLGATMATQKAEQLAVQ